MSKDCIKLALKLELSDLIYQHHRDSCQIMNLVMIGAQWVTIVVMLILKFTNPDTRLEVSMTAMIINLMLAILVSINCYVHNKTWKQAKEQFEDIKFRN